MYPNASTDHKDEPQFNCSPACLFDIQADPCEHNDLAQTMTPLRDSMTRRFHELAKSRYEAPQYPLNPALCAVYLKEHRGFLGPYYP